MVVLEFQFGGLTGSVLLRFLLRSSIGLVVLGYGILVLMAEGVAGFFALLPRLVRFVFRPLIDGVRLIGWLRQRIAACVG